MKNWLKVGRVLKVTDYFKLKFHKASYGCRKPECWAIVNLVSYSVEPVPVLRPFCSGKDSPSSKLLFAKDIPLYRQLVVDFYHNIHTLPQVGPLSYPVMSCPNMSCFHLFCCHAIFTTTLLQPYLCWLVMCCCSVVKRILRG